MDTPTYQKKMSDYFCATYVQMALEMANDVGILDILYTAEQPLTSIEIAEQGNLKERYVREILGSLATAEAIQVDASSSKFHIPQHQKAALQHVMVFGKVANVIRSRMEVMKDIFKKDGPDGTRYDDSAFNVLKESAKITQDSLIDSDLLACIPDVKDQLEKGIPVAEFGCAQGIVLSNLAARYPKSTFLGSDISEKCLEEARQLAAERGLTNISFEVYDLCELSEDLSNTFDWIFVQDTLHDLPSPANGLKGIKRALKKDGTASLLEFGMKGKLADNIGNMFWAKMYVISTFLCIPESYQRQGSNAFGACWGVEKARKLFDESGFSLVQEVFNEKSPGCVHYVLKK